MRYFIELSFLGKNYHGWQIQPNAPSVQEVLTQALEKIFRTSINLVGAGRTDSGVHAEQMFAHFDIAQKLDKKKARLKLNAFLPDDIYIKDLFLVDDDLHARFSATKRSYEYRIYRGRNPFLLDTTYQLHQLELDVKKMNLAAKILLEYTNFKCFSKTKTDVKTYNCNILEAKWIEQKEMLIFCISADRFLRNMVRAIVGTLIEIGLGKRSIEDLKLIIKSQDRKMAGKSVPAQGLFLTQVHYKDNFIKKYE